jgi:hypothetical protein
MSSNDSSPLFLVLTVALALTPALAIADGASTELAPDSAASTAAEPRATLTVEPAFFGLYGVALVRDGVEVGPGFLTLELAEAVRGSEAATAHASLARRWAVVNLGLTAAAVGLAAGSLATHADAQGTVRGWPDLIPPDQGSATPSILAVGMLVSMVGARWWPATRRTKR